MQVGYDATAGATEMPLTSRQIEIAVGMWEGRTLTEIAEQLGIARKTASAHKAQLFKRMGVTTNAEFFKTYQPENAK